MLGNFRKMAKRLVFLIIRNAKTHPGKMTVSQAKAAVEKSGYQRINYQKELNNGQLARKTNRTIHLSIIIPVYNGEQTIERCLKSVISQKTGYTYEAICIDDGSSDRTAWMLDNLQEDIGIKLVVHHQNNKGIAASRNKGLELAHGEYVSFLDADDELRDDFVERLLSVAYAEDVDYVKAGYQTTGGTIVKYPYRRIDGDMGKETLTYDGYIWGAVSRHSVWDDLCFPEGYWNEDMITRFLLYKESRSFVSIDESLYLKHENHTSNQIGKGDSIKSLDQFFLAKELATISSEKYGWDDSLYRCLLVELGRTLYSRTKRLDRKLINAVFVLASQLMQDIKKHILLSEEELNDYEFHMNRCFSSVDFKLWRMVSVYDLL